MGRLASRRSTSAVLLGAAEIGMLVRGLGGAEPVFGAGAALIALAGVVLREGSSVN
jgi:hypothetical protein